MDKEPFHLLRCEGRPCCKTGHTEHLHCLQLRSLLFIVYLKVLLCSRPTAVCRDDHSRDKTVIHTQRLWCSNSACAPQSLMKEEAWELFFFLKSAGNTGGGASAVMGVVILIFCDTEQTYSHFFPSYTLQPQLNRGPHSSIMWMSSRPVLNWTSVHLYAAVQTMCCP